MTLGSYRSKSAEQYTKEIRNMNLIELQDEAFKRGVLATSSREILIDRLERKYIQEHVRVPDSAGPANGDPSSREAALKILARGK